MACAALGAGADRNHSCSDTRARNRTRFANVSLGTDDAPRRRPPAPGAIRREGGEARKMLARHRQSLILQAVRSDGSARVSDLTQRLGVSDMTIRRDLEVLARDGLVEKGHGGAVLPGSPASHEPGFEAKLVLERPEETSVDRAAASMVTPSTASAIGGRTTTVELAQCLLDVPGRTIVTNSLRVTNPFSRTLGLCRPAASAPLTVSVRTPSD